MTQQIKPKIIAIFDDASPLGEQLIFLLGRAGHQLRIITHKIEQAKKFKIYGVPGQIQLLPLLDFDKNIFARATIGVDIAINLLEPNDFAQHKKKMNQAYLLYAEELARSSWRYKLEHVITLSSIHASLYASSYYAKLWAMGDKWIQKKAPSSTLIQTDLMLDSEKILDPFWDLLKQVAQKTHLAFLPPLKEKKFHAIYIGDVARMLVALVQNKNLRTQHYELVGPKAYSLKEILAFYAPKIYMHLPYPKIFMRMDAFFLALFWKKFNKYRFEFCFERIKTNSSSSIAGFEAAKITPIHIEQLFAACPLES